MKKLAIITKTTTIKERTGKGFVGGYTETAQRSIVIRFLGIPVFISTIIID